MTTKVTVDVNGRYLATVIQVSKPDEFTTVRVSTKVYGRYDGSPNATGQRDFYLSHGPVASQFDIFEEPVPDALVTAEGSV